MFNSPRIKSIDNTANAAKAAETCADPAITDERAGGSAVNYRSTCEAEAQYTDGCLKFRGSVISTPCWKESCNLRQTQQQSCVVYDLCAHDNVRMALT